MQNKSFNTKFTAKNRKFFVICKKAKGRKDKGLEPNRKVVPPKFTMVTEGYNPNFEY